jgi:short-subunit dehydrogenase
MKKEFALVTGASKGLGRAFAHELSKRKINTILVSLPNEDLNKVSSKLEKKYGVTSVFKETDLTKKENVIDLAKWVNQNYAVNILINNAGAGGSKRFLEADVEYIDMIVQLNVMLTAVLTHQILPNLMRQPKSYILNVSSMAAFSPMGYKTVYPASKTFVYNFTRGLQQELKDTNVFVSVVSPGPMNTKNDSAERLNQHGILAKMALLTPEKVAKISIRKLFKHDVFIMLNKANGFNYILMKIIPVFLKLPLITRAMKKEVEIDNAMK